MIDHMALNLAIYLARSNPIKKLPKVGAVLSVNRQYMIGRNTYKTHPLQKRFAVNEHKIHMHAEIAAIVNALRIWPKEDIKGSSMYVARVHRDGTIVDAKPCTGCMGAIAAFGISSIHWTEGADYEVR